MLGALVELCTASACPTLCGQDIAGLSLCDETFPPKDAFRLLYIWHKVYSTLPYNRQLQDLLFKTCPPPKYWTQWLVLEEMVPLPPVQLPDYEIEELWGISKECVLESHRVSDDQSTEQLYKYTWKELHNIAVLQHEHLGNVMKYVLRKQFVNSHDELEWMYHQYCRFRFQWMFAYWLFGVSKPCSRNLRRIYLWWQTYSKKKTFCWGTAGCDVQYFASLHHVTEDYWRGKLAKGDETLGIRTVENYFSMCKSLLAWILGRSWGRLKQKKVYLDTLEGVYRELKLEMQGSLIVHEHFWQVAKVQMTRVCKLEETAVNYVNWRIIDSVPYYR
ncbi:uncharacterized protein LOC122804416 isoform X2 [Protopterus annectens]|uniref:uncharacterized protein LOC122804416 isoform X2 n=1 Tax=Protopterus annectens TaxID=7888 RepID=UPI001CFA17FF|nr:uncharacterized protein LOC122804416 isoform X2 [Protopterus annectens]